MEEPKSSQSESSQQAINACDTFVHLGNHSDVGAQLPLRSRDTFERDYRAFQRTTLIAALGAMLTFFGLMFAMLPFAPTLRQFFRNQIGGALGESLLGASLPLAASPPVLLFFVWMAWRTHDSIACIACGHSFASHTSINELRNTGRCPTCGVQQFTGAPTTKTVVGEQAYAVRPAAEPVFNKKSPPSSQ